MRLLRESVRVYAVRTAAVEGCGAAMTWFVRDMLDGLLQRLHTDPGTDTWDSIDQENDQEQVADVLDDLAAGVMCARR